MDVSDVLKKMAEGFFKKLDAGGLNKAGKELVKRACCFAANAHAGQERFSGEDFIFHAVAVAELLLAIRQSAVVIAAGILHDTVEDTAVALENIEEDFGPEVAFLVDGMTRAFGPDDIEGIEKVFGPQVAFATREILGATAETSLPLVERDIIYQAKLFVMAMEDHRLVFIRLADRVHNLRTLKFLPLAKQKSVARETLEIHLPLANIFLSSEELRLIKPWLEEMKKISLVHLKTVSQSVSRGKTVMALSLLTVAKAT